MHRAITLVFGDLAGRPDLVMVEQAARELNLDLKRSWLIGDRTGDLETARVCGLRSVLLRTGCGGADGRYATPPTAVCDDLLAAARLIIGVDGPRQAVLQGNV